MLTIIVKLDFFLMIHTVQVIVPRHGCAQVARIVEVGTIENSDKLYKLKADAGGELLQIVAGLRPYITESEMQDRMVVVVLNLKAAKLAGQLSEAMILAADCPSAEGGLHVATLQPPAGAQPGDPV